MKTEHLKCDNNLKTVDQIWYTGNTTFTGGMGWYCFDYGVRGYHVKF